MSSSPPTVKDLYKVVTADLSAFLSADKQKDQDPSRETIQGYLDRFVKANSTTNQGYHVSTPTTPLSAAGPHSAVTTPIVGGAPSSGAAAAPTSVLTTATPFATTLGSANTSSAAAGQRHANELPYQTLSNNTVLQHPSGLPFAFHRLVHVSSNAGSPSSSAAASQNASATGSPVIGGGATIVQSTSTGQAAAASGANTSAPTPSAASASISATNLSASVPLAAQRFSAHLVTLFTQHAMGAASIASITTRMTVYLTHLLPFLTPRLVMTDWWTRMIEPSLQGEIRLSKDALKACRELVVECMVRDNLLDCHGSGTGSLLVAGDEEGQLDPVLAKTAMPISQFILRKYIIAAHDLNHRLPDVEQELHVDGRWQRGGANVSSSYAGHGSGYLATSDQQSEYTTALQEMENQQRLFSKARAVIRRKKDILTKNLETILFAYGGNVGRVKDFFSCLYTYFVGARYRPEILGLLCQFIRRQYDTSPLIVSLGLMTLIMLMPRIPAALNERLPDLFLILSRIICWPKSQQQLMALANQEGSTLAGQTITSFNEFDDEGTKRDASRNGATGTSGDTTDDSRSSPDDVEFEDISLFSYGMRWRRYGPTVPGTTTEGAPDPTAIFSFIYGLFPCNLLKFLHSPREYIRSTLSPTGSAGHSNANAGEVETADNDTEAGVMSPGGTSDVYIDEDLLKSRVQILLKRHSLHPELLTMTPEEEIVNKTRWQKLEPMEVVAMCVGLDVWSAGGLYGTGPILRSIEEDRRGAPYQDSDDDDEVHHQSAEDPYARSVGAAKAHDNGSEATHGHSAQPKAQAIFELGYDESPETPIEILAREDFFGPQPVKENHLRSYQSPQRVYSGPGIGGTSSSPRMRTKSKEVRMSQILRAFATLRGLDQEEYLSEARHGKSLGPGLNSRERWPSIASVEGTTATASSSNDPIDTPADETEVTQDCLLHPTTMANLTLLNREYRRTIAHLERDLLIAKNELNFELFLKQQHIQQISKVHRAHVLDASVEAERQNLYNTCRSLKAQLQETKLLLEKEKSELEKRKNKQTHWDTDLKNKLQTFRDERKQLQSEVERLKQEISDTRQSQEIQERLLTEERKGTFQLKNSIEDLSPKLKKMEEYEKRIDEMARQLVVWETEQSKTHEIQRQLEVVVGRWQNVELLLTAEKEETRILKNKVSQQSQVLDDMRIQMAINDGHEVGDIPQTPTIRSEDGESDEEEPVPEERPISRASYLVEKGLVPDDTVEREHSIRRKASASLRHRASTAEMNWNPGYSQSNNSQQGIDQQRKAIAIQEFIVREKERWDRELQEAHYRWSREAMRNQELEDRILDLQGQLEMTRNLDMRKRSMAGISQGGQVSQEEPHHENFGGIAGGEGNKNAEEEGTVTMMGFPSEPQNVPFPRTGDWDQGMRIREDHFGDGDTDDGGIESSGMIGRFSRRHRESEDEDFAGHSTRIQSASEHTSESSSRAPASSTTKGKNPKQKSLKTKWFSPLERSQTDRAPQGTTKNPSVFQSHLGSATPGIFDLALVRPPQLHRKSESSSTTSSSTLAARAATGGLIPPTLYARSTSHISDGGSSDIASDSDACTTGSGSRNEGRNGDQGTGDDALGTDDNASGTGESSSTSKGNKSKSDREKEREKERIRLMSGMGPLVDPSKMYRNVRML
ncbi:hypothetical protein BGX31_002428 [Mortierella sp. GBA43]|nr:hypothetical protein BGX31_002428 [Mortierella sp. GBA43]